MKKLLLLFTFLSSFAFGQMENFVIENNQTKWQKVYETGKDISALKKSLTEKNNVKITAETENSLSGEFYDLIMNYKKAGFTYMGTPLILNETNKYKGLFDIEIKDDRYRATIRNVKSDGLTLKIMNIESDIDGTLEDMAIDRKGNMRKAFPKVAGKIIDTTFTILMDLNQEEMTKEDW